MLAVDADWGRASAACGGSFGAGLLLGDVPAMAFDALWRGSGEWCRLQRLLYRGTAFVEAGGEVRCSRGQRRRRVLSGEVTLRRHIACHGART